MLNHGADINLRHNSGWSAVMFANQYGHTKIAKLISKHETRMLKLIMACQTGHTKTAKHLLQQGVNVNMQTTDGWSALMYAVQNGFVETVKMLIQYKADVSIHLKDGFSALMCACQNGHIQVAKILLEHGANPKLQDRDGWNALLFAQFGGHNEIIELLQSEERKRIVVSQESKPSAAQTSTTQMTRSAGKTLHPPSPYPYPAKYTAFKQMSASVSIAQQTSDQDITGTVYAEILASI